MLSSISEIQNTIDVNSDFSFVDRLGSFINNREMHLGYEDFQNGSKTPGSFIWESLSAIGNEIGNTIYTNIRDYIDLVSNIDRCKCNNLHSMFKMYGETYSLLGNYNSYPLEVRNLIDIFSINKKYLLKNDFLKEDFKQDLIANEVINGNEYSEYDSDIENIYLNTLTIDDNMYSQYIENTFKTLLSDFLNLKYNDEKQTPVLSSITNADLGEFELSSFQYVKTSDIEKFKRMYSIPSSFDEQKIVDNIDNGLDFIDNYVGFQQELIYMEIARRSKTLENVLYDDFGYRTDKPIELKTRYSYYRKAKVLEYYNFLNNFFNQSNNIDSVKYYDYNQSYFEFTNSTNENKPLIFKDGKFEVNDKIVELAAKQLTNITLYICSLREKIKLQTRKNYMKGTTNLLRYLINQYLVDYSKISPILNSGNRELSNIYGVLSSHSIDNVDIIEYVDQTEYFNIRANTDDKSLNGKYVNPRYWEGNNKQESGKISKDEIRKFYLRDLGLSSDSSIKDVDDFLNVVFNLGADSSYIDKNTGLFVTKLSSNNDVYSDVVYNELTSLQYHWNKICEYIERAGDYTYTQDMALSNQISDIITNHISTNISIEKLSGISDMYNSQFESINTISVELNDLEKRYNEIILTNYPYYFTNTAYQNSGTVMEKIDNLSSYVYGTNEKSDGLEISDDVTNLKNIVYYNLRSEVSFIYEKLSVINDTYNNIAIDISSLHKYGYTGIKTDDLYVGLNDAIKFIDNFDYGDISAYKLDQHETIYAKLEDLNNQYHKLTADYETNEHNFLVNTGQKVLHYGVVGKKNPRFYEYWWTNPYNRMENKTSNSFTVYAILDEQSIETKFDNTHQNDKIFKNVIEQFDDDLLNLSSNLSFGVYLPYRGGKVIHRLMYKYEEKINDKYLYEPTKKQNDIKNERNYIYLSVTNIQDSNNNYLYIKNDTYGDQNGNCDGDDFKKLCKVVENRLTFPTRFTIKNGIVDKVISDHINTEFYSFIVNTIKTLDEMEKTIESMSNILNQTLDGDNQINYEQYLKKFSIPKQIKILKQKISDTNIGILTNNIKFIFTKYKYDLNYSLVQYQTTFNRYKKLFSNDLIVKYLTNCEYDESLITMDNIYSMLLYIDMVDQQNEINIQNEIQSFYEKFINLNTIFSNVEDYIKTNLKISQINYNDIEKNMHYANNKLEDDIYIKTYKKQLEINEYIDEVKTHIDYIIPHISSDLNTTNILSDVIETKLDELNYQNYPEYQSSHDNFVLYNGLCANSDIYYNYKNITHPSKQYHPYLYNFVDIKTIIDDLSEVYNEYTIEKLNDETIQTYIDQYIGNFGESINIWKNNVLDYTGYTSKYEQSQHIHDDNTNTILRIVDYDGAFYPGAVDFLQKYGYMACISALQNRDESSGILKSFYDEYYKPLNLSQNEINTEITNLIRFGKSIEEITKNHGKNDVYDIYKYGVDLYGNTYTLYKRYKKQNGEFYSDNELTYKNKKNTTGKLWIRLSNRPFAYPAFSLGNKTIKIDIQYTSFENSLSSEKNDHLNGVIYDFEFSNDKHKIAFMVKNLGQIQKYETSNTFISKISYDLDANNEKIITISDADVQNVYERFEKQLIHDIYSADIKIKNDNKIDAYTLVNILPCDSDDFIGIYANKRFYKKDDIVTTKLNDKTNVKVLKYNNGLKTQVDIDTINSATDDIASTQVGDNNIALAVNIKSPLAENTNIISTYTSNNVPSKNSEGYDIHDYKNSEMNSHNIFTSDIVLYKLQPVFGNITNPGTMRVIEINRFNTNADISYIPVYPGTQTNLKNIQNNISDGEYYSLELLGNSRNIDDIIRRVNPTPDPYFTINSINNNHIFGRIYEEYDFNHDNTVQMIENPPIHNNTPVGSNISYNEDEQSLVWTINTKELKYTNEDYNKLKMLMFNRSTFGKSPYFIIDIKNLINHDVYATYNNDIINTHEVKVDNCIHVTGTYDNNNVNLIESNRIYNIENIIANFDISNEKLIIKFKLSDIGKKDHTFIQGGLINIYLLNDKDLTMFEYYHYLDAYGIYISADLGYNDQYIHIPENEFTDTYSITYSGSNIDESISAGIWNYYVDDRGSKRYLRDIDFSSYGNLNDIDILNNYKKVVFKYDEELHFDISSSNYFYPTLNLRYPKTYGQYVSENHPFIQFEDIDIKNVFKTDELYILDIPNQHDIISSVGEINIPVTINNDDFILVSEELFDGENPKYTVDDPRILEFTIHEEELSDDVNDDDVENKDINSLSSIFGTMILPDDSDTNNTITTKIDNIDIQKLLRIYVNYKKDVSNSDDIVLYFNYYNYINTPFIKIENSKIYSEIIEGTYLKLAPGESGKLDIVVQLRYMENNVVSGYKNIKLISYQIFNISDEKPKFIIREIYRISENIDVNKEVIKYKISPTNNYINIEEIQDNKIVYRVNWSSNSEIKKISFDVVYDPMLLKYLDGDSDKIKHNTAACITVTVDKPHENFIDIPLEIITEEILPQKTDIIVNNGTMEFWVEHEPILFDTSIYGNIEFGHE